MRIKYLLLVLCLLINPALWADGEDAEAYGDLCPRFSKKKINKFIESLENLPIDSSNTRNFFTYKKYTWFIDPVIVSKLRSKPNFSFEDFHIFIDAQGSIKLRCYYKSKDFNFHITAFFM